MQATQPAPNSTATPIKAEAAIDDVKLTSVGSTGTASESDDDFKSGEGLQLSMRVNDAPAGMTVTTYWYGPGNRQLAYESKTVDINQQQLTFTRDNTAAWPAGSYRAEVWAGGEKVEEETFDITAG